MSSVGALNAGSGISVRELKENVSVSRAQQQTKKDGLDQVYVEGDDGQNYVAYGREIENARNLKPGDSINLTTSDGKKVTGTVSFVDDEVTSAREGAIRPLKDAATWSRLAGAAVVGTTLGGSIAAGSSLSAALGGGGLMMGTAAIVGTGLAVGAGAAAVIGGGFSAYGAIQGAMNKADESRIQSLVK